MRCLSIAWLLPLLFVAQSAEAARISFATKDCGTPPLLGLTFSIDANGEPAEAAACPQDPLFVGVPGGLVDDTTGSPLYGTTISTLQFTITSSTVLDQADFQVGDFYGAASIDFTFDFDAFINGGGILTILFTQPIVIPCDFGGRIGLVCAPLDLLIFVDGFDQNPLPAGTGFQVTSVNNIPEPATLSLIGLGLAAVAVRRRRLTTKP